MTILSVFLGLAAVAWLSVWAVRWARRTWQRVRDYFAPQGITFALSDVPLSPQEWACFAGLAVAKRISQKALLAECVRFYLHEKTK